MASKVHRKSGVLEINDGGVLVLNEGSVINDASVSLSAAASETENVCEVTVQGPTGVHVLHVYLSDDADGEGLTATTASGAVAAASSGGVVLVAHTAKKHLLVQTKADGSFVLSITDSAKTAFYVCATSPVSGKASVLQLATEDYGAAE